MRKETTRLLNLMHPAAFSYDHQNGVFHVAEQAYAAADLPLRHGALASAEPTHELPDTALVHALANPVMLPKMYNWLEENGTDQLFSETSEVMRDVFQTVNGKKLLGVTTRDTASHIGFNVNFLRQEHPHITLQTLGNCACLGVDLYGIIGERYWDDKIAEFTFHNTDTKPQQISLLAGLGHIAHRVNS